MRFVRWSQGSTRLKSERKSSKHYLCWLMMKMKMMKMKMMKMKMMKLKLMEMNRRIGLMSFEKKSLS
jgi:hypothetical protein